jgi:hypothetical protein
MRRGRLEGWYTDPGAVAAQAVAQEVAGSCSFEPHSVVVDAGESPPEDNELGDCVAASVPIGCQRWSRAGFAESRQPPAMAPTIWYGSVPVATASGSGVSGGSWDRSFSQAKNLKKGRLLSVL